MKPSGNLLTEEEDKHQMARSSKRKETGVQFYRNKPVCLLC